MLPVAGGCGRLMRHPGEPGGRTGQGGRCHPLPPGDEEGVSCGPGSCRTLAVPASCGAIPPAYAPFGYDPSRESERHHAGAWFGCMPVLVDTPPATRRVLLRQAYASHPVATSPFPPVTPQSLSPALAGREDTVTAGSRSRQSG